MFSTLYCVMFALSNHCLNFFRTFADLATLCSPISSFPSRSSGRLLGDVSVLLRPPLLAEEEDDGGGGDDGGQGKEEEKEGPRGRRRRRRGRRRRRRRRKGRPKGQV